jgi:hypothetical protein
MSFAFSEKKQCGIDVNDDEDGNPCTQADQGGCEHYRAYSAANTCVDLHPTDQQSATVQHVSAGTTRRYNIIGSFILRSQFSYLESSSDVHIRDIELMILLRYFLSFVELCFFVGLLGVKVLDIYPLFMIQEKISTNLFEE